MQFTLMNSKINFIKRNLTEKFKFFITFNCIFFSNCDQSTQSEQLYLTYNSPYQLLYSEQSPKNNGL